MKKIRLDLEALDVVSFTTDDESGAARGTVRAHNTTEPFFTLGGQASCNGGCFTHEYPTCYEGCPSGVSCDYLCPEPTIGCYFPPAETEDC